MAKRSVLIAYFSHSGNTQTVAREILEIAGGDLFEISPVEPYPRNYDAVVEVARKELRANSRPALKSLVPNLGAYDEVYLGYPNWWGTIPDGPVHVPRSPGSVRKVDPPLFAPTRGAGWGAVSPTSEGFARARPSRKAWRSGGLGERCPTLCPGMDSADEPLMAPAMRREVLSGRCLRPGGSEHGQKRLSATVALARPGVRAQGLHGLPVNRARPSHTRRDIGWTPVALPVSRRLRCKVQEHVISPQRFHIARARRVHVRKGRVVAMQVVLGIAAGAIVLLAIGGFVSYRVLAVPAMRPLSEEDLAACRLIVERRQGYPWMCRHAVKTGLCACQPCDKIRRAREAAA